MDNRAEVREFLVSRRAKLTPERAGLSSHGRRRVPGLRRSEVAALAGVSVEYYSKLERGSLGGVSAGVLNAIARALQLDPAERAHLFHLAQAADGSSAIIRAQGRGTKAWSARASLQWTLDTITNAPAIVGNDRMTCWRPTTSAARCTQTSTATPRHPPNFARFAFLDSAAHRFYPDWERAADTTVANLRTAAGRNPHDKALHDLVGELSTRSDEFRRRWSAHNVRTHGTGVKHFHHHVVGDLTLAFESLDLRAEPGLTMTIYAAEPGSATEQSLALLASWAATRDLQPADRQAQARESGARRT